MLKPSRLIMVMGVSGCGKSTIGSMIAVALNVPFLDGDHYHPPENVEKMRSGTPLVDADRWPWLERLVHAMKESAEQRGKVVSACSALKREYRDFLVKTAGEPIAFIHLYAPKEVIAERQANRPGHFMPASLLDSQYETLEMPAEDENAVTLSAEPTPEEITETALEAIRGTSG